MSVPDRAPSAANAGPPKGKRRGDVGGALLARTVVTIGVIAAARLLSSRGRKQHVRARAAEAPYGGDGPPRGAPGLLQAHRGASHGLARALRGIAAVAAMLLAAMLLPGAAGLVLVAAATAAATTLALEATRPRPSGMLTPRSVADAQAAGAPVVSTSRSGDVCFVDAHVRVGSKPDVLWRVVASCLNGGSPGVLRDVKRATVMSRPAADTCVLHQEVEWKAAGVLKGTNKLQTLVRTNHGSRSLDFQMLSRDSILRVYSGTLCVEADGADACVLRMQQSAEGNANIVAKLAGRAVLRTMMAKQTRTMLNDFKTAAEAVPSAR